jgi:protoheme IX farnesyltransferase
MLTLLADYAALTKPRLNLLVVVTSAAGYYLGAGRSAALLPMLQAACGTALVAGGAAVLNQVYERDTDGVMRRTRTRPLPDGRVGPEEATLFGAALSGAGIALLYVAANALAAALAFATLAIYVAVYTPLKRRSEVATLVGAVPGALPPLIGWTASHGGLSLGGWLLFAIVFLWQIPHFMAISWLYRDDYALAKFPMLAVIEPDGRRAGREAVLYTAALVPVSVLPSLVGVAGLLYFWLALALGASLLWLSIRFARSRSGSSARALFIGSIVYLPLIWAAMILNP